MNPVIVTHDGSEAMGQALTAALGRAGLSEREVCLRRTDTPLNKGVMLLSVDALCNDRPCPDVQTLTLPIECEVPFMDLPKHRGKHRGRSKGGAFGRCRNRP